VADFGNKAEGFDNPTQLPATEEERERWLKINKQWWESHPMRYDFSEPLRAPKEFSEDFYKEIDKRFFDSALCYAPWKRIPFDSMIDFESLAGKYVLEIGVGNGSHALLLAQNSKQFVGIDLTEYAVNSTKKRMEAFGVGNTRIQQMSAEKLEFPDNCFDFVWSWGVIHHTADTSAALQEIYRVLKPGGSATIMVYYRSFWHTYIYAGFFHGVVKGYLLKEKSVHKVLQRATDGAIARYYSLPEWGKTVAAARFKLERAEVMGQKTDLVLLPAGKIKDAILDLIPNSVGRFFTNTCRMGYFLVSTLRK
jgi:ubiquinone/menaquinone biosynthesis C-methylase UbiE